MGDDAPNEEELEKVTEDIERARETAKEAVDPFAEDPKETYVDSGDDPQDDDEMIVPPG
jgi:hypothetical protein